MSKYMEARLGFEEGERAETRPDCVTDEHLEYLDRLRKRGSVNMFGARPYLMDEFPELGDREAATVMTYWMKSFAKPDR